ncbi:MAG TPA: hypothetical protein VFQ92_13960 [Blastocatellia bacterium]|nr:hypothetical protein [Blastocatellia bacterium]
MIEITRIHLIANGLAGPKTGRITQPMRKYTGGLSAQTAGQTREQPDPTTPRRMKKIC